MIKIDSMFTTKTLKADRILHGRAWLREIAIAEDPCKDSSPSELQHTKYAGEGVILEGASSS